jgi:hypothetical protein
MIKKCVFVIQSRGLALFIATLVYLLLDQWVTQTVQAQLFSQSVNEWVLWGLVSISVLVNFIFPLVMLVVVFSALHPTTLSLQKAKYLIIEQMRAWGKSALWTLALILPGLIKMVQFLFVPLVVLSDADYQKGSVDALKQSCKLSRKVFWSMGFALILFMIVLPLGLSPLNEYKQFASSPTTALPLSVLETLLNVCLYTFLVCKFDEAKQSALPSAA